MLNIGDPQLERAMDLLKGITLYTHRPPEERPAHGATEQVGAGRLAGMLLAFETSCDETSVGGGHQGRVLANVVSSQVKLHAEYGGVVPELAAREHLRNLLPVARAALARPASPRPRSRRVAATRGPGLPGALLVASRPPRPSPSSCAGRSSASTTTKPTSFPPGYRATARRRTSPSSSPMSRSSPAAATPCSCTSRPNPATGVLGSTLDDAAGECFDKVGKLLGFPYPAGPEIDRLAEEGNSRGLHFPAPDAQRSQR